jgi:hypothetical protein
VRRLAPGPDRRTARAHLAAQVCRAAAHPPVDPRVGATSGPREQLVGLPAHPR